MKRILLSVIMVLLMGATIMAQKTINGTVTDTEGEPLIGANVYLADDPSVGTITDFDGEYELDISEDAEMLEVSFTGFETKQVELGTSDTYDITLAEGVQLNEAVVTAMGISKEEKALGYSTQSVSGEDVSQVAESNVVNSLAGKISGVQMIGSSGAAVGGSAKIRLRGVAGLTGGEPLYVVDGTPIQNNNFSGTTDGYDFGNLASDINPSDIKSVNVLKGAAAAALYGNRAKNGVVMITTKSGEKQDGIGIDFSTSFMADNVYVMPEYQNQYAGGYSQDFGTAVDPEDGQEYNVLNYAADESWGPRMDGTEYRPWWSWFPGENYGETIPLESNEGNIRNFYNTGITNNNNIAFSGSDDYGNFRVSFTNFNQKGVIPNSSFSRKIGRAHV